MDAKNLKPEAKKHPSLEKMRALLIAKDPSLANQTSKQHRDTSIFSHWEIAVGASATIRFLPDGNEDNTLSGLKET